MVAASTATMNINNVWLPYGEDIARQPDFTLTEINDGLRAVLERDTELEEAEVEGIEGAGWNERGVGPHLKRLDSLIRLKLKFTSAELKTFLEITYRLILSTRLSARSQVKLLRGISTLSRQARIDAVWANGLSLDAGPLYARLKDQFLDDDESPEPLTSSQSLWYSLRSSYMSALHYLRHYYSPESVATLIETLSRDLESTGTIKPAQSLLLLVALLPSKLPPGTYDDTMPKWLDIWQTIDSCPEWDLLWLRLFCRARKYTKTFCWEDHLPTFYTYLFSTFSLPLGAAGPGTRQFPSRFRALFQPPIQHYNRLLLQSKLIAFLLGRGGETTVNVPLRPTQPNPIEPEDYRAIPCSEATRQLILLLSSLRTYAYPSNAGQWSDELGFFLTSFSVALARRVGWQTADADYDYAGGEGAGEEVPLPPLPERDLTAIVEALIPLAHQTLACLRPALVARLTLPVLVAALDPSSLTTTHQAPAALKALSVLAQPLLVPVPYLATYLPILLTWSLPGLDSNDLQKTVATVQFYISLLDWLPIRSQIPTTMKDDAAFAISMLPPIPGEGGAWAQAEEAWERMYDVVPALAEWAIAVMERGQILLVNKEGSRGTSAGVGLAKSMLGKLEAATSLIWRYLFRSLFSQMDTEMHAQARAKAKSFVLKDTLPDAVKDGAYMLECLTAAAPIPTLHDLIPVLVSPVPAALPARTLAYRTRLLANTVRFCGGMPLLPYLETKVFPLLLATLEHEDKDVRKAGGKLMRRALQSLTEIYPTDYASAPGNSKGAGPFLAPPANVDTLQVSWHIPTSAELQAAVHLLQTFVLPALQSLEQDSLPKEGEMTAATKREVEERWRHRLKILLNGLRGSSALLIELQGTEVGDDEAVRVGCRLILQQAEAAGGGEVDLRGILLGLRQGIAESLNRILPLVTREGSPLNRDVKVIKTWCKSVDELLIVRVASRGDKAPSFRQGLTFSKHMGRNWVMEAYRRSSRSHEARGRMRTAGVGAALSPGHSRRTLVERVYVQHLLRANEASFRVPRRAKELTATAEGGPSSLLFQDLINLSAYHISTVRTAAQDHVDDISTRYPWHLRSALPQVVTYLTLGPGDAPEHIIHEKATAATFLLRQPSAMRQLASSWPLTDSLLRAMAGSSRMVGALARDKQETLTRRLSDLTLTYLEFWEMADLTSNKRKTTHAALVSDLASMLRPALGSAGTAPSLHWRYQLLILWQVLHLTRPDSPHSPIVWEAMIGALGSGDGQPLQKMALSGIGRLLAWALPASGRRPRNSLSRPPSPGPEDYVVLPDPSIELQDDEDGAIAGVGIALAEVLSTPSFCRTLCLALAHDHRETDGGDPRWSAGVEELIRDARARWGGSLPLTRFHFVSTDFVGRHAQLVRFLLRGVGPRLLTPLMEAAVEILDGMPTEHERAYYATVAEVMAGLVSEYTRSDVPEARRARLWNAALPAVEKVLPKLSYDYSNEWADGFRFAATQRSPRLLEPLIAILMGKAVHSLGGLPAGSPPAAKVNVGDDYTAQAKWLRLLQPFLIEAVGEPLTRTEGHAMAARLLPSLLSCLGHPYKVCREQIAWMLFLAFGYGRLPLAGPATGGVDVVAHVRSVAMAEPSDPEGLAAATASHLNVDEQVRLQEMVQQMSVSTPSPLNGEEGGGGDKATKQQQEEVTRRRETVLRWILTSVQNGDRVGYGGYVLPLLDVVYECVRDREEEIAMLGKHAARFLARGLWLKTRDIRLSTPSPSLDSMEEEEENALVALPKESLSLLLHTLLGLTSHKSWYVKLEAASALAVFQAQHRALLSPQESEAVLAGLINLLGDERREVQDAARLSLSSFLSSSELSLVGSLAERHAGLALEASGRGGKGKRRKDNKGRAKAVSATEAETSSSITSTTSSSELAEEAAAVKAKARTLQTSTLLLASLILAYPYEVPPFIPRALTVLARLNDGPATFQVVIRKTLTDFKRTHQDEWDYRHKLRFTPDELDALSDVLVSPHYYA